jgi:multicomponent Na+:H+ antiporter subunit E
MGFILYFIMASVSYLVFTASGGNEFLFWQNEELIAAAAVGLLFSVFAFRIIPTKIDKAVLNPITWILGLLYFFGPFLFTLLIANLDVLYRIITGHIRPAIVKVSTDMKSEAGVFILANSITLTPGTLTIEMTPGTHELYIHSINWTKGPDEKAEPKDVSGMLHYFCKKIFK